MKKNRLYIVMFAILLIAGGCTAESLKERLVNQEKQIESYIEKLKTNPDVPIDTIHYLNGVYRVVYESGTGWEAAAGDTLSFYYRAYDFNTGVAYDSSGTEVPETNRLGAGAYIAGLEQGLMGMQGDEHALILLTGKQAYGDKGVGILPAYTPVMFEIYMLSVKKK